MMATARCECGMPLEAELLLNPQLLEFPTERKLREWVQLMRSRAGAKLKLGEDLS